MVRMARLLDACISVLGAATAVALVYAASWITAYGPDALAEGFVGSAVQLVLWGWALSIVLFGSFRHVQRFAVVAVSFIALFVALIAMQQAVEDSAFLQRGQLTTCVIASVDKRVSTHTDSEGNVDTTTYYVHKLSCAAPQVHSMTTSTPAGRPGGRIAVRYDPRDRLGPILADEEPRPDVALWVCAGALSVAVVARVVSEARGVDPAESFFSSGRGGLPRVRYSAVLFAAGACLVIATMAGWGAVEWVKDTALGWFGTDPLEAGRNWWHWLVDVPFWALYAAAFAIAVALTRAFWLWLLRAVSWLDPDEAARGLLAGLETSYSGLAGGLSFFFDSGFIRAIWSHLTGRRRPAPEPTGPGRGGSRSGLWSVLGGRWRRRPRGSRWR
jgi:hypothetical protein